MPITFNSEGGFLNGTISSSNGDVFIITSGSAGSINVGNVEYTGSQIIEKDSTGKARNKKTFNADGTITQEKFDANARIVETKIKNPSTGEEFVRSGSSQDNEIIFKQNASGAFITVSGSNPGFNIVKSNANNQFRQLFHNRDLIYGGEDVLFTIGIDDAPKSWYINGNIGGGVTSNTLFEVSQSGDVFVKGNIHAQEFHTELISSSIVFQSGSTQFGDTPDDTHTFTGKFTNAITASADISSSGAIIGNTISIDTAANVTDLTNLNIADSAGQTGINLSLGSSNGRLSGLVSGLTTTSNVQFNHITSSGNISSSGTITMLTASIGGGIFTSASLAAGGSGGDSSFTAAGISGSLGSNATTIRTLTKANISGSLGSNATLIRSLDATGISGSLGGNATLIRSLTAAGISGSITDASSSLASRTATLEGNFVASAASISGSLGSNATLIRTLTAAGISGSTYSLSSSIAGRVTTNETKLSNIENNADVTDTSNVTSAGALMDSELSEIATVKALTKANISGSLGSNATLIRSLTANSITGSTYSLSSSIASRTTTLEGNGVFTAASISGSTYSLSSSLAGRVSTNELKLSNIENNADVTDTSNVTSAGALMDSELSEIATVKALTKAGISGSSNVLSSSLAERVAANEVVTAKTLVSSSGQINSLINDTIAATIVSEIDAGEIPITKLAQDAITIAGTATDLGGSITADTIAGQISNDTISGNQINGGTINAVTITDLTATTLNVTHFTSSFITSSTIQTEGSNIFGDTIADTHLFNGHITASGNISASGTIQSTGNISTDGSITATSADINGNVDIDGGNLTVGTALQLTNGGVFNFGGSLADGRITWDTGYASLFGLAGNKLRLGSYNQQGVLTISSSHENTMVISGSSVGIGVVDPDAKLEIVSDGNSSATKALEIKDSGGTNLFYVRNDGVTSVTHGYLFVQASAGAFITGKTNARGGVTDDQGALGLGASGDVDDVIIGIGGHITASGNISSSGTGIFNNLEIHGADGTLAADYIIHKDDDNTKFGFPQNDKFKIQTAGTNRYVVDTTHTFTGDIIADSDISASGTIKGGIYHSFGNVIGTYHGGSDTIKLANSSIKTELRGTNITISGPVTASGDISSSGVIYGKQIQHTYHQFDNASNANNNYIPAPGGYVIEGTSINYYRQWLAPYKGKIKKIVIHAENDCGTTRVSLYTNGVFSGYHQQALGATTAVVFDTFTGGLSGNPNFNQHDLLAISVDPGNTPGEVNLVCSWEYEIDS